MLIEAPAGLLDNASPEDRIRAEVEEETGFRVTLVKRVFEAFMSPGSVTERPYFFVAAYNRMSRARDPGNAAEGEDIEVFEMSIDDAEAFRPGQTSWALRTVKTYIVVKMFSGLTSTNAREETTPSSAGIYISG
jgi:8-oxo-dGTP pyrophosphatase MutT (NUDIX family)